MLRAEAAQLRRRTTSAPNLVALMCACAAKNARAGAAAHTHTATAAGHRMSRRTESFSATLQPLQLALLLQLCNSNTYEQQASSVLLLTLTRAAVEEKPLGTEKRRWKRNGYAKINVLVDRRGIGARRLAYLAVTCILQRGDRP